MQRWQQQNRTDILQWVQTLDLGHDNLLHTAWIDPQNQDDVERCPWLLETLNQKGYLCGIESTKPDHCRAYPEHATHAVATGCPGYQNPEIS